MFKFILSTFFKRFTKDLLSKEVTLESESPFDPFESHLSCSVDAALISPLNPNKTTLPEGSHFFGTLTSPTPIQIDGHFEGTLIARELTIGKTGSVKADLNLQSGKFSGKVTGKIEVSGHLTLTSSAHILGDVSANTLTLEHGAVVTGSIHIKSQDTHLDALIGVN